MSEKDTILVKVKKLLDKAASTDSEAEAQEFLLGAQRLLAAHNLEMSQVEKLQSQTDRGQTIEEDKMLYEELWESDLMYYICKYNFCEFLFVHTKHLKRMTVIGKRENVEVVQYLYSFYRSALLQLSVKAYNKVLWDKKHTLESVGVKLNLTQIKKHISPVYIQDYIIGGINGIDDKMYWERKRQEKEMEGMAGMIVFNDKAVKEYVKAKYPKLKGDGAMAGQSGKSEGYQQGFEDGKNISVFSAIEKAGERTANNGKLLS